MDVNVSSAIPATSSVGQSRAPRQALPQQPSSSFDGAQALDRALEKTPDVRHEMVQAAREQASLAAYPPPEAIDRIARLLAFSITVD